MEAAPSPGHGPGLPGLCVVNDGDNEEEDNHDDGDGVCEVSEVEYCEDDVRRLCRMIHDQLEKCEVRNKKKQTGDCMAAKEDLYSSENIIVVDLGSLSLYQI